MPEPGAAMAVSDAGIKRRFRETHTNSCAVIGVRAVGGLGALVTAVTAAVTQANESTAERGGSFVHGQEVFGSNKEALFYLVSDGSLDDVRAWLAVACDALERGGWRGKVLAPSNSWGPEASWRFRDNHIPWNATLGLTLTRRTTQTMVPGWPVGDDTTREVIGFARDWAGAVPGAKYFMHGASQIKLPGFPPPDLILSALKRSWSTHLTTLGQRPHIMRSVSLGSGGRVTFSVKGVDEHWRSSIAATRAALIRFGPALDCAWIAYGTDSIDSLEGQLNWMGWRGLKQGEWERNRHLWSSYVPEVFGIQVLTAAHLDRAKDLRDWKLTAVGNDRYLVEAKDLEHWYSQPTPYPSARGFGRSDFGDMVLTDKSIRADPHGWLAGDGAKPPIEL